jgi:hypothetical protein
MHPPSQTRLAEAPPAAQKPEQAQQQHTTTALQTKRH